MTVKTRKDAKAATPDDTTQETNSEDAPENGGVWHFIKTEAPFFLCVLAVLAIFRFFIYDMNLIPSESMQPTMEVGDRIIVNKLAYGYSRHTIPFSLAPDFPTKTGRIFGSTPKRGDMITFKHPTRGVIYIKRVIGLSGDRVQYKNGRLWLNNKIVGREKIDNFQYKKHKSYVTAVAHFKQTLEDGRTFGIYEITDDNKKEQAYPQDNTEVFTVPEGHLFVMGDNRDNSEDSRFFTEDGVGFLPVDRVLGRAERVFFSTYRCKKTPGLKCAKRKFFSKLD